MVEKSHLDQLKTKTCDSVFALCQKVCREASLQPQQLQVLARYTSPECPLSAIFPHKDTLLLQHTPAELHELSSRENAPSSPEALRGDCQPAL